MVPPRRHRLRRKLGGIALAAAAATTALSATFVTLQAWSGPAAASSSASSKVGPLVGAAPPSSAALRSLRSLSAPTRRAAAEEAVEEVEAPTAAPVEPTAPVEGKRLLVLGGNGYVGSQVARLAVDRGWSVTSLSRRGQKPDDGPLGLFADARLDKVRWVAGDATDPATIQALIAEHDAVVHAIGLLFDANSGLANLNLIVSGSGSVPTETSTYDRITRLTAFNVIEAAQAKSEVFKFPWEPEPAPTPVLFVSAAEAGWPDVSLGPEVETNLAPDWLKEYLKAKRAVEAKIQSTPASIRPVIVRPSLIWSWDKWDVLPIIPIFNLLNAIGVPFVDKTVTVFTLSKALMAGLENDDVSGVQRFDKMEELEARFDAA